MRRATISFCAAVLLIACDSQTKPATEPSNETKVAGATSDNKEEPWKPVDSATAEKAMMAAGTPGAMHQMLAKSDGNWKAESTMWWSDGGAAMKSTGTMMNKMILGGRYQQTSFKGKMGEWPMEGTGTVGYDNAKKVFFTTWMDNMSTGMMNMEGTWDEATKSINFKGKMLCPANGQWCEMREVYKVVDDKHHVMEMYGPDMKTGKEFKTMEIQLTKM